MNAFEVLLVAGVAYVIGCVLLIFLVFARLEVKHAEKRISRVQDLLDEEIKKVKAKDDRIAQLEWHNRMEREWHTELLDVAREYPEWQRNALPNREAWQVPIEQLQRIWPDAPTFGEQGGPL